MHIYVAYIGYATAVAVVIRTCPCVHSRKLSPELTCGTLIYDHFTRGEHRVNGVSSARMTTICQPLPHSASLCSRRCIGGLASRRVTGLRLLKLLSGGSLSL